MLYRLIGLGLLLSGLALGCAKSKAIEDETSLTGNWLLSITQEYKPADFRNVSTVLLSIKKNDAGEYVAEIQGGKPALPRAN